MMRAKLHRWVRLAYATDFLLAGWVPMPTLDGTNHGEFSVHMIWLCDCAAPDPTRVA